MPHRILFAILFCLTALHVSAQSLTLKNGGLTKIFEPDTFYEMIFSTANGECCYTSLTGTVQRVYTDSIQVRVNNLTLNSQDIDLLLNFSDDIYEEDLKIDFAKANLYSLKAYKSRGQYKKKYSWRTFAAILVSTGVITLANSYDLGEKRFRDGILISSAAQVGLGISFFIIGAKKEFTAKDGWHF